jgi:hypothetical protein
MDSLNTVDRQILPAESSGKSTSCSLDIKGLICDLLSEQQKKMMEKKIARTIKSIWQI